MKAAIYETYGDVDVLQVTDVDRPRIEDDQVLVKTIATSVSTADWRLRASAFPGIMWLPGRLIMGVFAPRNRVLGHAFAGRVVEVGSKVTDFEIGDEVFGSASRAHAEYIAVSECGAITHKPAGIGFDEAASVPWGALSAIVFLRDVAKVEPGHKVLIGGASGGVGVFLVQLARLMGAEVTAVAGAGKAHLMRELGADHVIDYAREDFTARGPVYDRVIDAAGTMRVSRALQALKPNGVFVPLEMDLPEMLAALWAKVTGSKRLALAISSATHDDMHQIASLMRSGKLRGVIDNHYTLDEIAAAHERVTGRHKTGAVIVTLPDAEPMLLAAE